MQLQVQQNCAYIPFTKNILEHTIAKRNMITNTKQVILMANNKICD